MGASTLACYQPLMRINMTRVGLAAVILLAPGGFILGATLAANHYRKRGHAKPDGQADKPAA